MNKNLKALLFFLTGIIIVFFFFMCYYGNEYTKCDENFKKLDFCVITSENLNDAKECKKRLNEIAAEPYPGPLTIPPAIR